MSLNIISKVDITELSKTLIDIIKEEEKVQLRDMKTYLNKTNLSDEQKLKEYSSFSSSLFNAKITAGITAAQQYIIRDAELVQQKAVNTAQIDLTKAQKLIAVQEELIAREKLLLTKEQTKQVTAEIDSLETKNYLMIAETKVKLDNTVASTLSEARKNGAWVNSQVRSWTDPKTGQVINYQHLSLSAATASDTTQGLMGLQMLQLQKQADTFNDHTKLQYGNQITQLSSTAISEGLTSIGGLLNAHKQIGIDLFGANLFPADYTTIG